MKIPTSKIDPIQLEKYQLGTWYILPMLNLSIEHFGSYNDIPNYIGVKCKINTPFQIHIAVKDKTQCLSVLQSINYITCYTHTINYFADDYITRQFSENNSVDVLVFSLPIQYLQDYVYFMESKFNLFSQELKDKIVSLSGLRKLKYYFSSSILFGLYGKYLDSKSKDINPLYLERIKTIGTDVIDPMSCLLPKINLNKEILI